MAYLELAELKSYLDIDGADDNALLTDCIAGAQVFIELITGRSFEAVTATKYYLSDALDRDDRTILHLGDDLLTITTLTNGDSSATAIASSSYWLLDRNLGPPYHQIKLKTDISTYWEWDTDYWVTVVGTWGWTAEADANVKSACQVLAAYAFRQKDSQVFDTIAVPEAGIITIPAGIPATTIKRIMALRRHL